MNQKAPESICIVFAHLGAAKAKHLWLNIQRTHKMFPFADIHFIKDSELKIPVYVREFMTVHEYVRSPEIEKLRNSHLHEAGFRQGFWWLSLERILAVGQVHNTIGDKPIVHIESDVMLMPNFPFCSFENAQINWCRYNDTKDVAAILRIPTLKHSKWLTQEILVRIGLNPAHTDMTVLSEIAQSDPKMVGILPSFGTTEIDLRNFKNTTEQMDILAPLGLQEFIGVFDAAPIGMWLCGQDPRNHYGVTRYQMRNIIDSGDSFVDPSRFSYSYNAIDGLKISSGIHQLTIWDLHVHSKNRKLFDTNWEVELIRILGKKEPHSEFDLRILLALLFSNIRQRTLLRYCLNFPPIYRVAKPLRDRISKR